MTSHAPAPLGFARFSAYDFVPMSCLEHVVILPSSKLIGAVANGGPILPGWEDQFELRYATAGRPAAIAPVTAPDDLLQVDESLIWGGVIERTPARLMSETITRVLPSLAERPNDRLAFCLWPGAMEEETPTEFWEVMTWLGVPEDQILIVDQPLRAAQLWIAPQSEQSSGLGPSYRALEALAEATTVQGLDPIAMPLVFASSLNNREAGVGRWLGERYLTARLAALDVPIVPTRDVTLPQRMAAYAGAKTLICADGEAANMRMLLGYYEQDIVVLCRQPGARMLLTNLAPRCRTLSYGEVSRSQLTLIRSDGRPYLAYALSLMDETNLFRVFAAHGIALYQAWSQDAYLDALRQDVVTWIETQKAIEAEGKVQIDWAQSFEALSGPLYEAGLDLSQDDGLQALFAQT